MKAFLSHSSRDKSLVSHVAEQLGAANVEMDSETFDRGLLNVAAIQQALRRSSLFVLFLSKDALASDVVHYEALLAQDLYARGLLDRFLVICLDESSFASADENWKLYNFVRKVTGTQAIARLIQHYLILIQSKQTGEKQPFVGRTKELNAIKQELIDPRLTQHIAIYISGFSGIGRRTFAQKLFAEVYPSVISIFPEIGIDELDGLEEIYRKLNEKLAPIATLSAYRARITGFAAETDAGKERLIAQLLERVIDAREAILIIDHGGLLNDEGRFQVPLRKVIDQLSPERRPYIIFIADRMMPLAKQRELQGIIFSRLPTLTVEESNQLLGLMLRDAEVKYTKEELAELATLSEGHPFNVAFLVQAVKHYGIPVVLGDPSELTKWKRRRASEFLSKIIFTPAEERILAALSHFNVLDFDALVQVAGNDTSQASAALAKLIDYHAIEADADTFSISLPLRDRSRERQAFYFGPGTTETAFSHA